MVAGTKLDAIAVNGDCSGRGVVFFGREERPAWFSAQGSSDGAYCFQDAIVI